MKLKEKAWEFIARNGGALLDSEQFIEFSEENLLKFLSLDKIPDFKSEVDMFKAVLRWGNSQCDQKGLKQTKENLRTVLKNSKPLFRFPSMDADEFNEIVEPSGVLSSKECIQLFKYFISSDEKRILIGEILPYFCTSRTDYGKFVFCNAAINDKLEIQPAGNSYDQFTFCGNISEIKLKSVGIVLPRKFLPGAAICVSVGLFDFSLNQWTHSATKMATKQLEISYIEFENPVNLKLNVKYQLSVNCPNGRCIHNAVDLVKYSSALMKKSTFTWNTANGQHLIISCVPGHYVVWALQFEN